SAMSSAVNGVPTCSGSKPFCDDDGLMAGGGGGGGNIVAQSLSPDRAGLATQSLSLGLTPTSNSVFSAPTGTDGSDLLKLSSVASTDSSIELRLTEDGDRQARLDYLGFGVVDHDPGVSA